jgi:hypothetical protein
MTKMVNYHKSYHIKIVTFFSIRETAPIPGGCNMELPIKTAPFLPTTFTSNVLTIEYPLGSWPLNVRPATCDRAPLQYDIFIYYLPERDFTVKTGFDSIRLLSNITFIEKYGTKVSKKSAHYYLSPTSTYWFHLRQKVFKV